jgi:hypothetical protein
MVVETKYLVFGTNTYDCENKIYGSGNKFMVKNNIKNVMNKYLHAKNIVTF